MTGRPGHRLALLSLLVAAVAGCVEERCYKEQDCEAGQVCEGGHCLPACDTVDRCRPPYVCGADGRCQPGCTLDPCDEGFVCNEETHRCEPEARDPITCPAEMVAVADLFCLDRYEASRPNATAADIGTDESRARSVPGVLPWRVASNALAAAACAASGKRLCTPNEWELACAGPDDTEYVYGDDYDALTCNGIETYGRDRFRLTPTGAFPLCTNGWGAFDLSGNVWEHVAEGSDKTVRGGAFNCSDPRLMHRCGYVPGNWVPSARGFRCCLDADVERPPPPVDAGSDAGADAGRDGGDVPGCVSEDTGGGPAADAAAETGTDAATDAAAATDTDAATDAASDTASDTATDAATDAATDTAADTAGSDVAVGACPADMVERETFCIDRYEASRADATAATFGESDVASSRPGVLPWFAFRMEQATARAACAAAGKRLCSPDEWFTTCTGSEGLTYAYGNDYEADACNGIDAFCRCDTPECSWMDPCPAPHCRGRRPPEGGAACAASFRVMPTASFERCVSEHGVVDITGNVWELTDGGDESRVFRGGAYNCANSERLHRCDHLGDWEPSAQGFRCCRDL